MSDDELPTGAATKAQATELIQAGCDRLELPDSVAKNATQLFDARHAETEDYTPSTFDVMAGAAIYAAVKIERAGVPAATVADELDIDEKRMFRELKKIDKAVDIPIPIETPAMFVPRIVEWLSSADGFIDTDSDRTEAVATEIAEDLTDNGYANGCSGSGVAAGVVYALSRVAPWQKSAPTQQQVASAADVSVVTIRDHYQDILDEIAIEEYIGDTETDGGRRTEHGANR